MAPRAPLIFGLLLLLVGCSGPAATSVAPSSSARPPSSAAASQSTAAFPITLTDDAGRELTLDAAPERIVSLAPSSTEIVCALDACDRLVGVTDFDDYPAEVAEIEDVVIQAQVDVERVVAAEPDLVLASGNEITPTSVIEQLDRLGVRVMVLYPETLEEVYADIELVARAIDEQAAADELIAGMQERVADVAAAVEGVEAPRTLYEVFYAEGGTYTAGEESFLASLIEIAGAEPVTGDAQGLLGAEELVAADPELILLGTASYDPTVADAATALETVASRPGWADLSAVRDGRVVPYLDDIVTTRPGPRIVEGLEALARAIHPDRFD
jgi:iron complex transport system substrate-binding protein